MTSYVQKTVVNIRVLVVRCAAVLLSSPLTGVFADEPLDCLIEPHVVVEVSGSEVGVLASVGVEEADVVAAGDAIATLRTEVEYADLDVSLARGRAKSDIELLSRDHEFNLRKLDRVEKLHSQNIVSAQDVDEMRTAVRLSRLRLHAAAERRHATQLETVRDELLLARRMIYSPINGVVVQKHKSVGEYVDADPIVTLAQVDPLRVELVLPITMFGKVNVGMRATVLPELPIDGTFIASVVSIDPVMDAATATFGVKLSLPNPDLRLPAGLRCTLVLDWPEDATTNADYAVLLDKTENVTAANLIDEMQAAPELGAAMENHFTRNLPVIDVVLSPDIEASGNALKDDRTSVDSQSETPGNSDSCVPVETGPGPVLGVGSLLLDNRFDESSPELGQYGEHHQTDYTSGPTGQQPALQDNLPIACQKPHSR